MVSHYPFTCSTIYQPSKTHLHFTTLDRPVFLATSVPFFIIN